MKMTIKLILMPALLLAFLTSTPAQAQREVASNVPYCDDLITELKSRMQKDADANCKSVQTCVQCIDRTTKQLLYATLLFQPEDANCKTVSEVTETTSAGNDEKTGARAAAKAAAGSESFEYAVMQSRCPKGETSYEVYIPGNEATCKTNAYKIQWEVDGKKAGTSTSLQCVTGTDVKVTVTRTATGASKTKAIKMAAEKSAKPKAKPKD